MQVAVSRGASCLPPVFCALVVLGAFAVPGSAAPLTLEAIHPSNLNIRLTYAGSMPQTNATSPIAVGGNLILIDQSGASLYRRDAGGVTTTLFSPANAPAGVSLFGIEKILNVAANAAGNKVYVTFTSSTRPAGTPVSVSSRNNDDGYQVVYSYDFNGTSLSNPHPIRAFEVNSDGHTGGGMVVLDDGSIVLAFGDNGDAFQDGRSFAQDDVSHLSKIVKLNPVTGAVQTLAKGVRNVQRLDLVQYGGQEYLSFVDIGGNIAEELDTVLVSDLLDPASVENFGWGRSSVDGLAREGKFYIDANGNYVGDAPIAEAGFIQPRAEWGRTAGFFAGSGPISCPASFSNIDTLFGDLPTGSVYAVQDGPGLLEDVFKVNVFDSAYTPTSLFALAGGRPDPRFFCFGDGSAGVLLEGTGAYYLIDEVTDIPEPSSLLLLSAPLVGLLGRRRR